MKENTPRIEITSATGDVGKMVRETAAPPKPQRETVYVRRVDLRNRVWTGFLYGVGFWLGAIVGATAFAIIVTVITTVLGVGLAGLAGGMQP